MKRLLIYLSCFLFTGGLESALLSCSSWDVPKLKEQSIHKGLITYIPFTEGSTKDVIGNNDAIWWNSTVPTSSFTADFKGHSNSAIQLNGRTDYILLKDNPSLQFDTAFSISLWIKPVIDSLNSMTDRRMQIYNKSNFETGMFESYSSSMRKLKTESNDNFPDDIVMLVDVKQGGSCNTGRGGEWKTMVTNTNSAMAKTNEWHHLAVSYSSSAFSFYLDGVLLNLNKTISQSKIDNCSGGDLRFGVQHSKAGKSDKGASYTNYFSGSVDEIRIYNRSLTAAEVQTLYRLKDKS